MIIDLRDLLMAMEAEAKAALQVDLSLATLWRARAGIHALAPTTAAKLLARARALFGEHVTGLRDREGRVHFHADVITRLLSLEREVRELRIRVECAEAREFRLRMLR